ncbi:uncharacterized protein [Blastocystis hominis]|uniref:Uncharacterized protein n=1 Tax=Blastocystis hominis TaxID=12968 RepID=D8MBM9_BLAHO|nr:uncharacterized protein [Blastocystis hominis]CBK25468.2 unnamed protein product [Blastocystis hominis]|eukprot:XP_012899516.1 uncharacterized protein [Blastocystis hominis]
MNQLGSIGTYYNMAIMVLPLDFIVNCYLSVHLSKSINTHNYQIITSLSSTTNTNYKMRYQTLSLTYSQ